MASIRFLFDYLSPYAYLGWTQIHALAARRARVVEPVPVLLAGLLDANGQKGPAEIPNKRTYVGKDALRTAHLLGVPLAPPPTHPFNPLLALRASSIDLEPDVRRRLVTDLFAATWGGGGGVEGPAEVSRIASAAGLDGDEVVAQANRAEIKDRLRAHTDEAIAAGAFGVPTMLVDGELFWGVDSLGHLDRFLQGKDPITPEALARWRDLRPSATRR